METKEIARAAMDDYGVTYCENAAPNCFAMSAGDMPDTCPRCGRVIDWSTFKATACAVLSAPTFYRRSSMRRVR